MWETAEQSEEREKTEIKPLDSQLAHKLSELEGNLQRITSLSRAQQRTIGRLKDELSAARQMATETQLRLLNELQSLTNEDNIELKQTLISLTGQQQQQLTTYQDQHGIIPEQPILAGYYKFRLN